MAGDRPTTTFGQLINDGLLEIGDGYRAKNEELGGNGPMFLRAGHVKETHIDFDGVEHFHAALTDKVSSKMSHPGDAVITTKGNSTGRTAFVTTSMPEFVYSPHLSYWRSLDVRRLEPGFLRYWSRSSEFAEQLNGMMASTDMAPYLSLIDQRRLRISLPSPEEQHAIAHILSALDDKIELNRRMNETLEVMVRALFKSWFVDFDPVSAKAEGRPSGLPKRFDDLFPDSFGDSELGEIPKGWRIFGLDEIARFLNGLALQKFPPTNSKWLPVIKIAQLRAGNAVEADRASVDIDADYIVSDGDVLFSWSGSLECVLWAGGKGALNQHLFKVNSVRYPKWLYYLWTCHHLDDFRHIAAGKATTMGHIQRHHLSEATVALPSGEVLEALDPIFAPLIEAQWRRDVQSRTLAELRDTLLPKLISGELRVRDAEKRVEALA